MLFLSFSYRNLFYLNKCVITDTNITLCGFKSVDPIACENQKMSRQTVIIRPLQKGRLNKELVLVSLVIILAVTILKSVSGAELVSGETITESTLQNTQPMVIIDNAIKDTNVSVEKDTKQSLANQSRQLMIKDERTENSLIEDVDDLQVEGDGSHDEAYNSIIANYYTADPFFEGIKESDKSNMLQKHRKSIVSEKHKNGKLRHKIRVKSKKAQRPEPMQYHKKPLTRLRTSPKQSQMQYLTSGNKMNPSKKPIVKSLPSRRSYNLLKKKRPKQVKPKLEQQKGRNTNGFMVGKNGDSDNLSPSNFVQNRGNTPPKFSDQNAFPPNDDWGKETFYPSNAYPSPYKTRPDSPNPRPEEISQMPKIRIKKLKSRNKVNMNVSSDVEKRQISDVRMEDRNKYPNKDKDAYLEENDAGPQVATERQSFSELLFADENDKKYTDNKVIKPKIRPKGKPIDLSRGRKKNSRFNFKESSGFPGDSDAGIPLLPDIEGGNDPFSFLEEEGFGGPVIAGLPGGPESHSYFDIMGDFFDEPKITFPHPPQNKPELKEIPLPKHRYEEKDIFEPFDFSNHLDGENRELPDSFLPHPVHLEAFVNQGPKPEEFVDKHHYSHEPRYLEEQFKPPKTFQHSPSTPSHFQKNSLSLEVPHPRYPPLKKEYYSIKETESFRKTVPGFVSKQNNIHRPFEDDSFFHTTKKGHPYAEPLSHHNPLDYSYDPGHVEEFEIKKLPALNDYRNKFKEHHHSPPVVHELPRLKHYKHYQPTPVYHAKPDKPYSKQASFKKQSPYAFNLVSKKKPNTPYYDDYKHIKFDAPFKRQTSNKTKDRRKGGRLLKSPEPLILPDSGFIDIPKLGFGEELEFSNNPKFSPPPEFQIPEFLARSLSDDLDLQYGLFDDEIKYDLDSIDRKDQKQPNVKMTKNEDVTEFAPDDRWLERSIDVPSASFEEEHKPSKEKEINYERNNINLTPPPQKADDFEYDYNSYDDDNDVIPMPMLPPPPEMLKMTAGSSLLPIDVPKLGSRIPYQPPELAFDEFYKKTEDQFISPIKEMFKSKMGESKENTEIDKGSKFYSNPKTVSKHLDDAEKLFSSRSLPFEDEINGIYAIEENRNGFGFDESSQDGVFENEIEEGNYNYDNIRGFDEEISDFFPAFDIQKTISNRYDEGSKIDASTSTKVDSLPSKPDYSNPSNDYNIPVNDGIEIMDAPKISERQRRKINPPSNQNKLSFSNLISHPLNEVEMPTYTTYDPMEFKFRKERELNLQQGPTSYSDNDYLNPSKFQSRTLNIATSASEEFPEELSMQSRNFPGEDYWESAAVEGEPQGTNRRSLNYGRSLGNGPIPAVLPPPPHLGPHLEARGKPEVESHQFIHVKDWDKFKAGHGRGNEYHNLHDVQARDGAQHKEAVSFKRLFQTKS